MMLPPLPAINDAIGLLAALGDPERTRSLLDEAKGHIEVANKALADAQAAQLAVDEDRKVRDKEREEIGRAKIALAEERDVHIASVRRDTESIAALAVKLERQTEEIKAKHAAIEAEDHRIRNERSELAEAWKELKAREEKQVSRESELHALIQQWRPILRQLGLEM